MVSIKKFILSEYINGAWVRKLTGLIISVLNNEDQRKKYLCNLIIRQYTHQFKVYVSYIKAIEEQLIDMCFEDDSKNIGSFYWLGIRQCASLLFFYTLLSIHGYRKSLALADYWENIQVNYELRRYLFI